MVTIQRAVNNISINGTEFVLDEAGQVKTFANEAEARKFLLDNGELEKNLDSYIYEDEPATV
jgi:hypothetical protein